MKKIILLSVLVIYTFSAFAQEECSMPGAITSVTYKKSGTVEKIVFEFISPAVTVTMEKGKPPFTNDPTGETVKVKGQQFREIRFLSVGWVCNIPLRLKGIGAAGSKIQGFKNAGQFEGYFTYVMGCTKKAVVSGPVTTTKGNKQYVTITIK